MLTPTTEGLSWPVNLLKKLLILSVLALTGCCSTTAVLPKLPAPAPDLMQPALTGSEYSARVTQNMQTWAKMLDGSPIK